MANIPIDRIDYNNLTENLSPSESVVTDTNTNLVSLPYSSLALSNSIVYRNASGMAYFNNMTSSASAPTPSGSSRDWFIPFDPNNPTNTLGSISIIPPRTISIKFKNIAITSQSTFFLSVTTGNGTPVLTSSYTTIGTYTTSSGSGSVTPISSVGYVYIYLLSGGLGVPSTSFASGNLDINYYIPSSGNGQLTVTGTMGYWDGTNINLQSIYGYYSDTVANMKLLTGISLYANIGSSPLFTTSCSADVVMNR